MKTIFKILILFFVSLTLLGEERATLRIFFPNLRGGGDVLLAVFRGGEGFPDNAEKAIRTLKIPVGMMEYPLVLENLPKGRYALSVLHDINGNGRMDTNWIGIPREGYGFSRNPKIVFSAPSFDEASFHLRKSSKMIRIVIRY